MRQQRKDMNGDTVQRHKYIGKMQGEQQANETFRLLQLPSLQSRADSGYKYKLRFRSSGDALAINNSNQ